VHHVYSSRGVLWWSSESVVLCEGPHNTNKCPIVQFKHRHCGINVCKHFDYVSSFVFLRLVLLNRSAALGAFVNLLWVQISTTPWCYARVG
jgi:hypothetical protein